MNYIYHKGRHYEVPAAWNQLSGKQLIAVTAVLHSACPEQQGRIRLLMALTGWSAFKMARICGIHRVQWLHKLTGSFLPKQLGRYLDNSERMATATQELTQFLFDSNDLTVQLLPQYKGLHGPSSEMANLRMGEFAFSEHYFLQWKATGDLALLNNLVATLYRPAKKRTEIGDMRIPFNPDHTEAICKKVNGWPLPVKLAIAAFYHGAREKKIADNKAVFEYEGDDRSESLYGLWSVMRTVAKAGHFGNFEQVTNEYVDTILMELHESIVEYEKHKEYLESLKDNQQHA